MAKPAPWTDSEVDLIKKLSAEGLSASEISGRLKTDLNTSKSRNAVIGKLNRLGVGLASKTAQSTTAAAKRARARRKAEASANLPAAKTGGGIPFDELNQHSCRWILDDNTYCGNFAGRKAFCSSHATRAYAGVQEAV